MKCFTSEIKALYLKKKIECGVEAVKQEKV